VFRLLALSIRRLTLLSTPRSPGLVFFHKHYLQHVPRADQEHRWGYNLARTLESANASLVPMTSVINQMQECMPHMLMVLKLK